MIKDLFKQDIGREIETVVKADDTRKVDTEIYEYVITNEIASKITSLFLHYVDSSTVNGAWISGFFGSGKSHLLKILSYVLSNRKMNDDNFAGEVFENKINEDDALLKGYIHQAIQIPAESILFNIDQQSEITSKADDNAILSVFYKVFYNHLGFYGSQSHIAEFEYWLFRKNKYDEFKKEFKLETNREWTDARIDYFDPDVTDAISLTCSKVLGNTAEKYDNILEEIEERETQSIDSFASKVLEYLNTKGKDFRMNFFVDEVGQYIANRTNLMTNLQTIVETLQTKTKSRVWIFVTSQSDIDSLIGDLTKSQRFDFSKIMDRFKARVNLTSANTDEVIEKRLLEKNEDAKIALSKIYNKEEANLKTLISLSDIGQQLIAIGDKENFIRKYPFLNYQFTLFQQCRVTLSKNNAFQGEYASVGERSMISVFQQIVRKIEEKGTDTLVSFDKMYDGISVEIRPEVLVSINTAEKNITSSFAIRVLKVLFMVKYYKEFIATRRNIEVLLIDNIHIDLTAHKENVGKALDILERQSYIQRNGDVYEFLTDIEKDIETDIKNTEISEADVNKTLKEFFFDEIFKNYRIRFHDNKQDYEFGPKLDGMMVGREKDLTIEIYTPNYAGIGDIEILKTQSMGLNSIRFVTDADSKFMDDLRLYLKIGTYHRINQTKQSTDQVRNILYQKVSDNNERKRSLIQRANELLGSAKVFLNGEEKKLNFKGGYDYAVEAFQLLIKYKYPNILMIGANEYSEDTIKRIIHGVNIPELFNNDDVKVTEPEQEILGYIQRRKNSSDRTSIYDLLKYYTANSFGWYNNAVFSLLAMLFNKGKIEVKQDENVLDKNEFLNAMLNTSEHARTYIDQEAVYSTQQINKVKAVFSDLFNQNTKYSDPKDIANDFKEKLKILLDDVNSLVYQKNEFPFLTNLIPFQEVLSELSKKNHKVYLENIQDYEDRLLDNKEEHYDPIKAFMNGQQKDVYRSIMNVLAGQTANFGYVDGDDFSILKRLKEEKTPYKGDVLRKTNEAKERITKAVLEQIETEKSKTISAYQKLKESLSKNEYVVQLNEEVRSKLLQPLEIGLKNAEEERYISNLRNSLAGLNDVEVDIINKAIEILTPKYNEDENNQKVAEPKPHYIRKNNLKIDFSKNELKDENDVNEYIEALRIKLLEEIKNNRRIKL